MKNRILLSLLAFLCLTTFSSHAQAETVLEKVARTGELKAGSRADTVPFSYTNSQGKLEGYSVDLLSLIHKKLEEKLNKKIKLNLATVTVNDRFREVKNGNLDIVCEATTITQERLERVDFSIPFFITGAQFLIKKSNDKNFDVNGTLKDQAIAYIPNTTTFDIIPQIYPTAKWLEVKNRQEGITKLAKGDVSAVVSDGILLIGELVKDGNDPRQFILTPRQPITTELYGCILPKNNGEWKQIVDAAIASPANHDLQEEWFNIEKSKFPYLVRTDAR
ncbi:MAG: amino acid ABC transporter substrate-binding protein [Snowella sp.]|jgi:polar amino acid transport system substrate-binding protein|nr:MAG: amino acid ABC transporter substrate-binding protein [Snowella sp.]